jgi:hypothetical protein
MIINVKDVKKFTAPLKSLKNSVNSIVLSKMDDTLEVNAMSDDSSQLTNLKFTSDIVEVGEGETEKFGIYDLSQFVNVLTMSDKNSLELNVENNIITIKYSDNEKIDYMLSDLSLIEEGPAKPKKELTYLASFEVTPDFIKKVKSISGVIGANVLKFQSKEGSLSYVISNKASQSHAFSEVITQNDGEDFEVSVSIKDANRDNFGFLYEGCAYTLSINPKIIMFEGKQTDYKLLRYYVAPLSK